ncbi:uncharacterized protein LOC129565741 isoform X2 [Sitodiplosis mosellana]|uniref:uncharacterized protein LOC129565741 isoform X2 n=1 Tax=Sitodiplosis mosellana TaxID=263140 RepID=UPI002443CF2B|nr:uncharacterized protein LOC129565741 isoform X2 [Sitodiplosis mosellana]
MDQLRSEFHEAFLQLSRKFNQQLRNQSDQIERQQGELNHQCDIIKELSWQIRDLRDSVRKCNDQISWQQSKNCIDCAKNRMTLNIPTTNVTKRWEHVAGARPIYGSINVDADRNSHNKLNKLKTQDAIDDKVQNPSYCRDVKAFLERCIPPPPTDPPPSDDDDESFGLSPLEFSTETLEKLNSLYSLYKGGRPSSKVDDETADVEYRLPRFNGCSTRPLRGSTKAVCSLASNFEEEYSPDDRSVKSLNESIEIFVSNVSVDGKADCQTESEQNRAQNDATLNDEVYI